MPLQSLEGYLAFLVPADISSILLQGLEERLAFVRELANKPIEGCKISVQHLNLLHTSGCLHV